MSGKYLRFHYGSHFRDGFNSEQRILLDERNRVWNLLAKATNAHITELMQLFTQSRPDLVNAYSALSSDQSRQNKIGLRLVINQLRPDINAEDPKLNKIIATIIASSGIWWQNRDSLYADFVRALRTNKAYLIPIRARGQNELHGNFNFRFQKPATIADLESGKSPVQITRQGKHAVIRMPIHADGFGQYRNGEWPFTWHRDLPEACTIRGINVIGRPIGAEWRLSVSFLISAPTRLLKNQSVKRCGVDVGWRIGPTGLRVATAVIDGEFEDLSLTPIWVRGMDYVGILDAKLNESGKQAWGKMGRTTLFPGWMVAQNIFQNETTGPGSDWMGATIDIRRERMNKLARLERERLDVYRKFAARLVSSSSLIQIEKLDLRRLLTNESNQGPKQKRQQRFAAVSILHQCIEHACLRAGVAFKRVQAYQTTAKHIACGYLNKPSEDQMVACKGCAEIYDQDANAALNIAAAIK